MCFVSELFVGVVSQCWGLLGSQYDPFHVY